MANPWHDETGKFCGKEEMRAAIDRLATSGNLDGYFNLRQEFQNIDQKKSIISDELLSNLAKSGLNVFGGPKPMASEADVREIYKSIRDELSNPEGSLNYGFTRLLEYQNLPKDLRDEILTKGNLDLKNKILYEGIEERNPLLGADILKIVEGETNPSLIAKVMATRKLTFEDKYKVSAQSESGLRDLASQNPKIFFTEPELENELLDKTKALLISNPEEAQKYLSILAGCSANPATHRLIIEKADLSVSHGSPYHALSGNKHLDLDSMIMMSQHMLTENIADSVTLNNQLAHNQVGRKQDLLMRAFRDSLGKKAPYKGNSAEANSSFLQELAELNAKKITTDGLTEKETRLHQSLQAGWDSYASNFKALTKEVGKIPISNKNPEVTKAWKEAESRLDFAKSQLAGNAFLSSLKWEMEN